MVVDEQLAEMISEGRYRRINCWMYWMSREQVRELFNIINKVR
jgi:hypothetical protein